MEELGKVTYVVFLNPENLVSLEGNKKVMGQNGCDRYFYVLLS